jgi:hypothetical protein
MLVKPIRGNQLVVGFYDRFLPRATEMRTERVQALVICRFGSGALRILVTEY